MCVGGIVHSTTGFDEEVEEEGNNQQHQLQQQHQPKERAGRLRVCLCTTMDAKKCCGYPRNRVVGCAVLSVLIAAAAITTTVVLLTRAPDDIETIEKNESDSGTQGDFTITRTAAFSSDDSSVVSGTLMFLDATADNSSTLAISDFRIAATDCEELNLRLLGAASSTSSSAEGLFVVPLTGAANATSTDTAADFTEPLGDDFDIDLYTQVNFIFITV